jgi:hypothetical protein
MFCCLANLTPRGKHSVHKLGRSTTPTPITVCIIISTSLTYRDYPANIATRLSALERNNYLATTYLHSFFLLALLTGRGEREKACYIRSLFAKWRLALSLPQKASVLYGCTITSSIREKGQ